MMKRLPKRLAFLTVVVLIAVALVSSNSIAQQQISQNIQQLEDCLVIEGSSNKPGSTVCLPTPGVTASPTPVNSPTPNLNLPEKERFLAFVNEKLSINPPVGSYEYILLKAYGAALINPELGTKLPNSVLFKNTQEAKSYQSTLTMGLVKGTRDCLLQKTAADALNKARTQINIPLKSGYGSGDCTRTYETNLRFWRKYADNGTLARVQQGKETKILGVVAPPGTSQHLWGLAIDLRASNQSQRKVLYNNGWFQTVENDLPHWTYLGVTEDKLPTFGFQKKTQGGITYWLTPL